MEMLNARKAQYKETGVDYYQPWLVMLMSDGAAESLFLRHDQSLAPAVSHLLAWSRELTARALKRGLTRNLKELIRPRTMDDVGIALLRVDGQGGGRDCMPMPQ
ncbi:hypothetical protein H261_20597 [Paramagnetospirillum caucaseum]|uniref:Uncharacterized protein n=1 Tax=Paramagnetospirillum caucaseum TaxID=1244869 RepID=M3A5A5_9PROT|nr:hypothetical protein [Paramagnetospirillum caucaseum]EME68018.1 hypothetical protein H261_20597 [Paramagnetospirillum caucaseum]